MMTDKTAVLLMQMGGPRELDEVEEYIRRLFADKDLVQLPPPIRWFQGSLAKLVSKRRGPKVRAQYAEIGGGSPNNPTTIGQAEALERLLHEAGREEFRCFACMTYSEPMAPTVLRQVEEAGCTRLLLLSLFPQFCCASTMASVNDIDRALRAAGRRAGDYDSIDRWGVDEGYLTLLADGTRATLEAAAAEARAAGREEPPILVVSAHGVPESYVRKGDPYVDEVRASTAALEARLPEGTEVILAFQSRVGPVKWVGPSTEDTLIRLGKEGRKDVVVLPISFVNDHIETLYEIDLELGEEAKEHGILGYHRVPAFNLAPRFIEVLRDLVLEHEG